MNTFEYLQPKTLEEASALLAKQNGTGLPFAGGTDALGLMKSNIVQPQKVVNLKKIDGLNVKKYESGEGLTLGALVTVADLAADQSIAEKYQILSEAANEVASPQLRNMGTIGGNLCQRPRCWYFRSAEFPCLRKGGSICYASDGENKYHAIVGGGPCFIVHPSDLAVALLALNAEVTIWNGKQARTLPLNDFYLLPEQDYTVENILQPGEIVTQVHVPDLLAGSKSGYVKMKERDVWDFAIVSVAIVLPPSSDKQSTSSILNERRAAFGGVAPRPWMIPEFNTQLNATRLNADSINQLTSNLFSNATLLKHNGFKVPLARNLTRQLLNRIRA